MRLLCRPQHTLSCASPLPIADTTSDYTDMEQRRAETYAVAELISAQLDKMNDSLEDTIRSLNKTAERPMNPNNPVSAVVHETATWLPWWCWYWRCL